MEYSALCDQLRAIGSITDGMDFLEQFLLAYDFPNATVARIRADSRQNTRSGVYVSNKLFYLDAVTSNLFSEFNILQRNKLTNIKARLVVIVNSTDMLAYDTDTGDLMETSKSELHKHFAFFFPLIGKEKSVVSIVDSANIEIAEKFAKLYNELLLANGHRSEAGVNNFVCLLLFSCFADSMQLLSAERGVLGSLVATYTSDDGHDLNRFFEQLIASISDESRTNVPVYFERMQFCDARFREWNMGNLKFSRSARDHVLDICSVNWTEVSPEIIGALIQTIIVPDAENVSSNYTDSTNVRKAIGPLFLDELYREYEGSKSDVRKRKSLLERIAGISIFDPACGAGNYLLVTFKEIRKLESLIRRSLLGDAGNVPGFSVNQLYGVESNELSCRIARLALFIVQCQEEVQTRGSVREERFAFGVVFTDRIINDNPLRIDWSNVCAGSGETYIVGNPPYRGARRQTPAQKEDLKYVFRDYEKCSDLDYAACWFLLATQYITGKHAAFCFVTTNSLTQGQQVGLLWPKLFQLGVYIQYAHTAFKWRNDARNTTAVTVVIVGVRPSHCKKECELFSGGEAAVVPSINPYLTAGGCIVFPRSKPISFLPPMLKGNMPYDDGNLLLSREEMQQLVGDYPTAQRYLRLVIGSMEFINGIERWCLWISHADCDDAMAIPPIRERILRVKQFRQDSVDQAAQALASRPHQFREFRATTSYSLVVPSVSSERREYIPIGFVDKKTIVTNLAFVVYDCEPWLFAVISSRMHNLWIRTVCGGLETRLRYSSVLGYNTFPFPRIGDEQKAQLRQCTLEVLAERERDSDKTMAEIYDPERMSSGLRYAHTLVDAAVERCYQEAPFVSDLERLNYLFTCYSSMEG